MSHLLSNKKDRQVKRSVVDSNRVVGFQRKQYVCFCVIPNSTMCEITWIGAVPLYVYCATWHGLWGARYVCLTEPNLARQEAFDQAMWAESPPACDDIALPTRYIVQYAFWRATCIAMCPLLNPPSEDWKLWLEDIPTRFSDPLVLPSWVEWA